MNVVLLSGLLASCSGCTNESPEPADTTYQGAYPMNVVATTGMVGEMVRRVGGEHVDVFSLMGEGVDPHLYKASPGDIARLQQAPIVFYSGLHLEGKLSEILEKLADKNKPVHAVTEGIPADRLLKDEDGAIDPHIWFDVVLWSSCIDHVVQVLTEFDPSNRDEYEVNAKYYKQELVDLDREIRSQLEGIPKERRVMVTAHDAFGYFARAFDVEVLAVQGISTDTEAGLAEINKLVDQIVKRKVRSVFVETIVSERNMQSLIEGCKARGHDVTIGGELYSDALGSPSSPGANYPSMMRHNVGILVASFQE